MTTIVADARAGVMVADSRCTIGGSWVPSTKVERFQAELIGCAGSEPDIQRWRKWYLAGKRGARPKCEDFNAIILRADGVYIAWDGGHEMLIERGYHAIGSGSDAAQGALMAGADAKGAVEIACFIDAGSGGDIRVFNLKDAA